MKISRVRGIVAGWAFLVGSSSVAFGQFAVRPIEVAMPAPVCGGCVPSLNLPAPALPQSVFQGNLSVPTLVVPPPPPPAVEVRAYPVVTDDRDRNRDFQQNVTPVELDVPRTEPSAYTSAAGVSQPAEAKYADAVQSSAPQPEATPPAPWYSVGDWSFGTWVVIFFLGLISISSGKR